MCLHYFKYVSLLTQVGAAHLRVDVMLKVYRYGALRSVKYLFTTSHLILMATGVGKNR